MVQKALIQLLVFLELTFKEENLERGSTKGVLIATGLCSLYHLCTNEITLCL